MHDSKGAEDALLKAVNIDPKLAKVQAELGQLELTTGDLQGAQKWLRNRRLIWTRNS
jgi:Flp pilus assembly protein TadD